MSAGGRLRSARNMFARRRRVRKMGDSAAFHDLWRAHTTEELEFWRNWFATKGGSWPEDYRFRIDPDSELQEGLKEYLSDARSTVRILDVGAGPLTYVGKRWAGHELLITAVDALGEEYAKLLSEFGIQPPVRTLACDAERLAEMFSPESFDLAYARNALDHAYEPMRAISQMVDLVRPGGVVLLEHVPNEAERHAYRGLHNWNFDVSDGRCLLWCPRQRFDLGFELMDRATVEGSKTDNWVTVVVTILTT